MHEHEPMSASTAGTFFAPAKELNHFNPWQPIYVICKIFRDRCQHNVKSHSYGRMCNVLKWHLSPLKKRKHDLRLQGS